MATYELMQGCGKHYLQDYTIDPDTKKLVADGKPITILPGDVIEWDQDLVEAFPGKFRRYGEQTTKAPVNRKKEANAAGDSTGDDNGSEATDVTEDFEGAAAVGVVVHKVGRKFLVTDSDGNELSDGPVTKAAASSIIADFAEPE